MKILSRVMVIIGILVVLGGAGFLAKSIYDVNILHAVAISMRSASYYNPIQEIALTAGLAVVGGFLTGLGLSLTKR